MNFLAGVLANVLVIAGIWNLFYPGMLLYSWAPSIEKLPKWINKPLATCPPCMASVWGSMFFLLVLKGDFCLLLPHCLAVSGANTLIFDLIYRPNDRD